MEQLEAIAYVYFTKVLLLDWQE